MASLLLADPDRNFRRAMEIALRLDGAEVAGADSLAEALALLANRRFELVVVDSLLGGADTLLERARASGAALVTTGAWPELLERPARRHGARALQKPFTAADLLPQPSRAAGAR
jgi:DNA-binding NtrC family response regulator